MRHGFERHHRNREEYERGLPDCHDPTGGIGGAAPTYSALTLRIWLASFGVLVCTAGAVATLLVRAPLWFAVVLLVLAVIAAVDLAWVIHRKLRGEPH
jgi:hypothetical protein